MFTVLSSTRNTSLYLIVAASIALVLFLSLAVLPSIAAPAPAAIPVTGPSEYADYYQRHPELRAPVAILDVKGDFYLRHPEWTSGAQAAIPVTGILESPDYLQRHPELRMPAGAVTDTTDYFARHPELRMPIETGDLSDYFLRH